MKVHPMFKNTRVVILIIALILSIIAINPQFNQEGVAIRSVNLDSAAYDAGIISPAKFSRPLDYEVIEYINGQKIKDSKDYYEMTNNLASNITMSIKTDKNVYTLITKPNILIEQTGNVIEQEVNVTELINGTNVTTTKIVLVNETIEIINGTEEIGLNIFDAASNNIRKGLDLSGGVRVLLKPQVEENQTITDDVIDRSISSLEQRLNAFGLNDVIIRKSSDLSGNTFILFEIAGLQKKEISELIASQGKFEAKISNKTAFTGGEDISYVCRSADCSGIDPNRGCGRAQEGYACQFYFTIDMTSEAAQRQADLTGELSIINENGQQYLSEPIQLFLDDQMVDELNIGAGLRGRAETRIQISGSGAGQTREEAMTNTLANMKRLQTIIETGSLPVKLDIVKIDSLSPVLGDQFLKNALYTGIIAILAVI
ncbi:hypothetical protein KY321_05185, partial [Candidatus Woesearchaeota archaeon]|nr:hypothetical protein [Candidatus Woesearchaeota archaeon]